MLVFCSAKRTCDNLVRKLEKRDISAVAMHGNLQQNARARALREFKEGKTRVLIATDVAGRGIDIEQLPCVINYELPRSPNDYKHRIGRTGRAGEDGMAISLISHNDYQHFKVIEKRNGIRLEREQLKGFDADETPPEAIKRSKPKKKAKLKNKKRPSLVRKKAELIEKKRENKPHRKKEKQAQKQSEKVYLKQEKAQHKNTERQTNPVPPAGASLYTRKLPKQDDK